MDNIYFERYAEPTRLIDQPAKPSTFLSVVIPCYNENELISSLESLVRCDAPTCNTEVIILINQPENCSPDIDKRNRKTLKDVQRWSKNNNQKHIQFYPLLQILETKNAGVGLARKIGMDEACRRFSDIGVDGVIACFDADSTCQENYFKELERHFVMNANSQGVSIHFEHPLAGPLENQIYEGITNYELHLRYYVNAMRFAGHPHAFHTIGSSMAVRASVYQKQGGMNRRKAGEDFYFLQKIIPLGNFSDLSSTTVYPSPRVSDRVPFGTGKAMGNWMNQEHQISTTYSFKSFGELKSLIDKLPNFYNKGYETVLKSLSRQCQHYLEFHNENHHLEQIVSSSPSFTVFEKKFFTWLSAFKVLKFSHFMRDNYYPNVPTTRASKKLLLELGIEAHEWYNIELLLRYRNIDSGIS